MIASGTAPIEGLLVLGLMFGGLSALLILADVLLGIFPTVEARLGRLLGFPPAEEPAPTAEVDQ